MPNNPNTATFPYLSTRATKKNCKNERDAIKTNCNRSKGKQASQESASKESAPEGKKWLKEDYDRVKEGIAGTSESSLKAKAKATYEYSRTPENAWIDDHCKGLWVKPHGTNISQFDKLIGTEEKIKSLFPGTPKSPNLGKTTAWADVMTGLARANPCITARRCDLRPYKETEDAKGQANKGTGCCPGQTGHHVLPGAMFKIDKKGIPDPNFKPCESTYSHADAPVICLEGADNHAGTHGLAHKSLDKLIADYKKANGAASKEISYDEARENAIEAVRKVNPNCSVECLRAQLDSYYKDAMGCDPDAKLITHSGMPSRKKTVTVRRRPAIG